MTKIIKIKLNNKIEIDGEEYNLKDFIIDSKIGMTRADYILQELYNFYKIPNWIDIYKKLDKRKIN